MSFFQRNKKIVIPVAVLLAVFIAGSAVLAYQINSDKILKNTIISNVNVGGLTKSEAVKKLKEYKKFENIVLIHEDKKWNLDVDDIDLNINFDKTVENAYNENRNGGVFSNALKTLKSDFGYKNKVSLVMNYDNSKLKMKLDEIKKELDSPVKNATLEFVDNKTKIISEEPGRDMNVDGSVKAIVASLNKNEFESKLDVKLEDAKFTRKDLKGIDTLLGSYSTTFGGMYSRDYNIKKSTYDSGNIILKSGEEYSFNGLTHEKTLANGYKAAPVIESGKLVMGIGGGVCQTSSTIFNAALLSGMEITNRRNHTIPSDYVKLGRDAMVVDGNPGQDLKFKNPYKSNVYIKNYISGNKVISEIYGSKNDKKNIQISTEMLGSFGGGSKTISDPSLPTGKRVVEKYSRAGYTVATYRIYMDENNNITQTEKIAMSNYPSQTGVVRVGAAKVKNTNKAGVKPSAQEKIQNKPNAPTGTTSRVNQ